MKKVFIGFGIIVVFAILYHLRKISEGLTIISTRPILPYDAKREIKSNKFDYILDVRVPEQFEQGHYEKASNLPIDKFRWNLEKVVPNKNSKILLMCNEGDHALAAGAIAERLGYKNTCYLDKGSYKDLN